MKKVSILNLSLIVVALFTVFLTTSLQAKADEYDSYSYQQLQQTADDSGYGANCYSNGSYDYEGASHYSSHNFDPPSDAPPVVDLSGSKTLTPSLLRNEDGSNPYAPKQYNSLHTTPPPMP